MLEVDIGLVEDGDLTLSQTRAQSDHPAAVMVFALFDNGKGGKKGLEVQRQM